jgi:hypothetical protein
LDEELELLPGRLTPRLREQVTRLGTWMPFSRAIVELECFNGARLSEPTARRVTQMSGEMYVAVQAAEVHRLEKEVPPAPVGAARMLASVDGAMVPLVGGEWTEVKTLALGNIVEKIDRKGERVIQAEELSYFSRNLPSEEFTPAALVETHRRGLESAQEVCGVCDGAEWQQSFYDHHCPDALRILDFPHAAGKLTEAAHAAFGAESSQAKAWLDKQCHDLKHDSAAAVLLELEALPMSSAQAQEMQAGHAAYLRKRLGQMRYAEFQAQGFPIGSGSVESAHKVVVEARLKQAGMHWARSSVNPMVALRNAACNDRWDEAWPQIVAQQLAEERQKKWARHPLPPPIKVVTVVMPSALAEPLPVAVEAAPTAPTPSLPEKRKGKYIPPPDHPWKKYPFSKKARMGGTSETRAKS